MRQIKKETRQIRISKENHKRLKIESVEKEITISDLIDEIIDEYYGKRHNKDKKEV